MPHYDHGGDIYGTDGVRLDFSVNTNPLGMPDTVRSAIIDALPTYSRYPDPHCRELRAALGAFHALDPAQILCGNGAAELIYAVSAAFRPKTTLVTAPAFSEYEKAVRLYGGEMRYYPLSERDGFVLTEGILEELTPQLDMLFLCTPNNPTGRLIPTELLCRIAEKCYENDIAFVLDECFLDFTDGRSMLGELRRFPKLLVLRAFTKIYAMAGLRLGTLYCAHTAVLERIAAHIPTWSVSAVAQAAGKAALRDDTWLQKTRRMTEEERSFMVSALRSLGLAVYPGDANFMLIKSDTPLYAPLLERGIMVRRCESFNGLDRRFVRIGLKTREENRALINALGEVLNG